MALNKWVGLNKWGDAEPSGTEQLVTILQTEQLSQNERINIVGIGATNPIIIEQRAQSILSDITESPQASVIVSEQLTHSQLIDITTDGAQTLNTVVCEQKTESNAVNATESLASTTVITEQLTQAKLLTIEESSGAFVSVVQAEQITQSELISIHVIANISGIVCEQNTQTSTQQISVDITLSAVTCEQLTHNELITIIEQNISQQLNIDIDQITIEMLTPTYTIEHL
jgi:hypothetical protein